MAIHELAINPIIQTKVYQEVEDFKKKNNNLTYDNIGELKYLDAVLNGKVSSSSWLYLNIFFI